MNAQSLKETIKEKIATAIKDNLKVEEGEFVNPWSDKDKASVLQNTRCFGETPIDAEKCINLLTRVLYLMQQGEKFTPQELTTIFFGVTKLFQAASTRLRRMVYLVIKELEMSEDSFIVVSSLIKDMNGKNDCFRANSIRVLSRVIDPAMVAQIDRYLKTAIVDKNPFVSSSALVCGINLLKSMPDTVRRWVNEIQETTQSKHSMVQFHALALIYELKKSDRLALHKVVTSLAKSQMKSPMAECLLIRYASQSLQTERDPAMEKTLMTYLDSCLRHKNEMVMYEAARAFCQLAVVDGGADGGSTVFGYDISHATTILQIFLGNPKPVIRFGAIRTLNLLAQHRPQVAARCNCDMEPLLTDSNRNTATLALTTLLKTGHESSVEQLVKQITNFMSDISDVFKIEVVRAVKGLCLQYPAKYKTLMGFLSSNLREDGASDFKKDLVDALILIVSKIPQAREVGLLHLCEFIEDCEYPNLCTKILAFLGDEVPGTSVPSKYIRFIYNRLILENALVRAAAVDCLTKIAMKCASLRRDILLLLQFGQNDNDDEVRDRISLYSTVLQQCLDEGREDAKLGFQALMSVDMPFSMDALYDGLVDHMGSDRKDALFNFADLPSEDAYKATIKAQAALAEPKKKPGQPGKPGNTPSPAEVQRKEAEQKASASAELMRVLSELTQEGELGPLQHTCKPKDLTETEAEYHVQVIKHMFLNHVVLELYVSNTVQGVALENIQVKLTGLGQTWQEIGASQINRLEYNQQGSAHIVLRKVGGEEVAGAVTGSLGAALHFTQKEEGDDLGYEDDYAVENISIVVGDYIFPRGLQEGRFKSAWEQLSKQGVEATQKLNLNFKGLEPAVEAIIATLNMEPCEKSGKVETGSKVHTLFLSGTFLGGNTCVMRVLIGMDPNHGCMAKLTCVSKTEAICQVVTTALTM
jgi:coatomer protein complex subunit gamma